MPFKQNLTSVGTSATLLCTTSGVSPDASGILVNNQGSAAVFIGSATVTTSGATAGISVAAGTTVLVPTSVSTVPVRDLWDRGPKRRDVVPRLIKTPRRGLAGCLAASERRGWWSVAGPTAFASSPRRGHHTERRSSRLSSLVRPT
jgi:hypothetical protein